MKHLLLALLLLGCEAPRFEFPECGKPSKSTLSDQPNINGCWRLTASEGHSLSLTEPGYCDEDLKCLVVVAGEPFYTTGAGKHRVSAEDVDCSETCP